MNRNIILKKKNEVYFELELDKAQSMELNTYMAKKAENYIYHVLYKQGRWDGSIYFFNRITNELPIGLLPQFISFCEEFRYPFIFDFDHTTLSGNVTEEKMEKVYDYLFPPELNFYPRDYQQEAVLSALKNKRAVLSLATGAGKSNLQYIIIRYLLAAKKKILLVVPSVSLVEQMYSDFREYGWNDVSDFVDKLYSGQELSDKPILISTYQSLAKKSPGFFSKFTALLIDETHQITAAGIQTVAKNCVNADYRLGFTGTVPKNEANRATLFGYLGPISYEVKSKELMDQGFLSQIKINNLIMKYPQDQVKIGLDYQSEVDHIIKYKNRNKALDYIIENTDKSHNTLILLQRIEHLREVKEYCEKHYKDKTIYDIFGDTDPKHREKIRKDIETKGSVILVSTFNTMGTGVNIKRLHNIVFFSSYKSEIKIIQSIGRGLRKHESKEHMILWDCVDDLRYKDGGKMIKNYSYKHWQNRKSYYEEQGFEYSDITINI